MKIIALSYIIPPDQSSTRTYLHRYRVFLGPLGSFEFKNRAQAQKFLAEASRAFNQALAGLNENYIQAFIHYRHLWPYLENNMENMAVRHRISQGMAAIEKALDRVTMYRGENQGAFTVKDLFLVVSELRLWWEDMAEVYAGRSDWAAVGRCRVWITGLDHLESELKQAVTSE